MYTKDKKIVLDLEESIDIHHFIIDDDVEVIINLNKENIEVNYYFSIINYHNNTFKITINHNKDNTISNMYNHGINVLNNKLVFDCITNIKKDIKNTLVNQDNQIININNGDSIIKPNLLISSYDSIANHSAFIGKFNEELLFYLMKSNLSYNVALNILSKGLLLNKADINNSVVKDFMKELGEVKWIEKQKEK